MTIQIPLLTLAAIPVRLSAVVYDVRCVLFTALARARRVRPAGVGAASHVVACAIDDAETCEVAYAVFHAVVVRGAA